MTGLLRRYWTRLAYLGQLRVAATQTPTAQEQFGTIAVPQAVPPQTKPSKTIPLHFPVPSANKATEPSPYEDVPTLYVPPPDRLATDAAAVSPRKEAPVNPFTPSQRHSTEDQQPVVAMQAQRNAPHHTFTFSWKAFVLDQAITLIGLLGAFLILMGALSSVVTQSSNRLLSFLIWLCHLCWCLCRGRPRVAQSSLLAP